MLNPGQAWTQTNAGSADFSVCFQRKVQPIITVKPEQFQSQSVKTSNGVLLGF